jgi:hypothetical protein
VVVLLVPLDRRSDRPIIFIDVESFSDQPGSDVYLYYLIIPNGSPPNPLSVSVAVRRPLLLLAHRNTHQSHTSPCSSEHRVVSPSAPQASVVHFYVIVL